MLYIIICLFMIMWCAYVVRKNKINWHSILNIYFLALAITSIGDFIFIYLFNNYELQAHLISDVSADTHLAIVMSDGIVLPLVAIIFTTYYFQHKRKSIILIFTGILMLIELVVVHYKYMVYFHWSPVFTGALYLIGFSIMGYYTPRLMTNTPPIPYFLRIYFAVFSLIEYPGEIIGGGLIKLYRYRIGLLRNTVGDSQLVEIGFASIAGIIGIIIMKQLNLGFRRSLFLATGILLAGISLVMHENSALIYNDWNSVFHVIRYIVPCLIIILYDKWEFRWRVKPYLNSNEKTKGAI